MTAQVIGHPGGKPPVLTFVVPCFNEEAVLPETAARLEELLDGLAEEGLVDDRSAAMFVDDGSRDGTWGIIEEHCRDSARFAGLKLSRNQGHQNALLSGLLTAEGDILISIDADLQDDLGAVRPMLLAHRNGADIVCGVRRNRDVDRAFKRLTATGYYRLMKWLGVDIVFNHADFRLMNRQAVESLRDYGEVNLFLRGIVPHLGYKTATVEYDRLSRFAGETKYPLRRMLSLAFEGITSFSTRPLRWITLSGLSISVLAFFLTIWAIAARLFGVFVPGWASTAVPLYFLGGVQLLALGMIGEYLGKVYLETKRRPRFIIERKTGGVSGARQQQPLRDTSA